MCEIYQFEFFSKIMSLNKIFHSKWHKDELSTIKLFQRVEIVKSRALTFMQIYIFINRIYKKCEI